MPPLYSAPSTFSVISRACLSLRNPQYHQSPRPPLMRVWSVSPRVHQSRAYAKGRPSRAVNESQLSSKETQQSISSESSKRKGKARFVEPETVKKDGSVGAFDLKALEALMEDSVAKLQATLKSIVARVERVTPALLDGIKVEDGAKRRPLAEFASVTVKDGQDLVVTLYDESFQKVVSAALYASPMGLTPQSYSASSLLIPIAKPTWEKRQILVRQSAHSCEGARVSIRHIRSRGQREIKMDISDGVVSKEQGRLDGKHLDEAVKKHISVVDLLNDKAKSV